MDVSAFRAWHVVSARLLCARRGRQKRTAIEGWQSYWQMCVVGRAENRRRKYVMAKLHKLHTRHI